MAPSIRWGLDVVCEIWRAASFVSRRLCTSIWDNCFGWSPKPSVLTSGAPSLRMDTESSSQSFDPGMKPGAAQNFISRKQYGRLLESLTAQLN